MSQAATPREMAAHGLPDGRPALPPRISWGAVFAGAVVAVAIGAMLAILGVAIGAGAVDAQAGTTPGGSSLGIAGGLWLMVGNLIGLAAGGTVAARLSGTADETDSVLHGLSVWAIGFLLSAVLLGNVVGGAAGAATRGAGALLGGLGQAAQSAAGPAVQTVNPQRLVERAQQVIRTGGEPAAMPSEARQAEITRLLTRRVTDGSLSQGDRGRLVALVAAEYQMPEPEAQRRITQIEQDASRTAEDAGRQAREAADAAATAGAVAAYWTFAAMLLGAVAAVLGARLGTRRVAGRGYA